MEKEWLCPTEEETARAGFEIAGLVPSGAAVHLVGDLGAGKTTLSRAIAAARGAEPHDVASPSFAIVHEYPLPDGPPIIHIDGYRLSESPLEWLEIGIDELLAGPGLKLIEWPKPVFESFEDGHAEIEMIVLDDDTRRIILRYPA